MLSGFNDAIISVANVSFNHVPFEKSFTCHNAMEVRRKCDSWKGASKFYRIWVEIER